MFIFRREIRTALKVLIEKATAANSMKLGPLELAVPFKAAEARTEATLVGDPMPKDVPEVQVDISEELEEELDALGFGQEEKLKFARLRLIKLSLDYELLRSELKQSSPERTIRMNEIMALMRTFAIPGLPALSQFAKSSVAGERLAALAILQVRSSRRYLPWLRERFDLENQPFIFFHAALVLRRMGRFKRFRPLPELRQAIEHGIEAVSSFSKGPPDVNTLNVLKDALDLIDGK